MSLNLIFKYAQRLPFTLMKILRKFRIAQRNEGKNEIDGKRKTKKSNHHQYS